MQGFQNPGIRRLCQIVPYDFFLRRWGQWIKSKERPFYTPFGNVAPFPTRGATCRLLRTPVRIVAQAYPQILNNSTSSHTILGLLIHTVCDCCSPSSEPTIIVRSRFVGPVWLIGCSQSDFLVQWLAWVFQPKKERKERNNQSHESWWWTWSESNNPKRCVESNHSINSQQSFHMWLSQGPTLVFWAQVELDN